MPLAAEIKDNLLTIHSTGHHSIEEGVLDLTRAMDAAKSHFAQHQEKLHILFDASDSEEQRSGDELKGVALFFNPYLGFLTGRMAFYVKQEVHYGLTRLFSVYAEEGGMMVAPFYEREKAIEWLGR